MSALRSDPPTHILALRVALGFAASLTIAEGWDLEFSFVAALVGATLAMGPALPVLALLVLPPLAWVMATVSVLLVEAFASSVPPVFLLVTVGCLWLGFKLSARSDRMNVIGLLILVLACVVPLRLLAYPEVTDMVVHDLVSNVLVGVAVAFGAGAGAGRAVGTCRTRPAIRGAATLDRRDRSDPWRLSGLGVRAARPRGRADRRNHHAAGRSAPRLSGGAGSDNRGHRWRHIGRRCGHRHGVGPGAADAFSDTDGSCPGRWPCGSCSPGRGRGQRSSPFMRWASWWAKGSRPCSRTRASDWVSGSSACSSG
jgi:hypothetical protein